TSIDLAGLGGNTNFYKPMVEGVWFIKQSNRLTLGVRAQAEYIHAFTGSKELPIFQKLFLGGEYSVRGFAIRTIGPSDPNTGLVVRLFMPVLNVPFRLIVAYNPQRGGVLDNTLQPQKGFQFRFAVGSTF